MCFIFNVIIRKKEIQKIARYSCLVKPRCSHKKIEVSFYHIYNLSIETDNKNQQVEKICKRSLIIEKSKGITEISFRSFFQFLFLLYLPVSYEIHFHPHWSSNDDGLRIDERQLAALHQDSRVCESWARSREPHRGSRRGWSCVWGELDGGCLPEPLPSRGRERG